LYSFIKQFIDIDKLCRKKIATKYVFTMLMAIYAYDCKNYNTHKILTFSFLICILVT